MSKANWNAWKEERGRHEQQATERGIITWNAYRAGGVIQFLGGEHHGEFHDMHDWPVNFAMPYRTVDLPGQPHPSQRAPLDFQNYTLTRCNSPYGSMSYAYVCDEDLRSTWPMGLDDEICDKLAAQFCWEATRLVNRIMGGSTFKPSAAVAFELEFGRQLSIDLSARGKEW